MVASFLIFAILFIVIRGQTVAEPELLVPNYDNEEHKLKGFRLRRPLVLHCNITKEVESKLSWEKNGIEVSEVDELKNRYKIIADQNVFIIERTVQSDAGIYSCVLGGSKKEFHVLAAVVVHTPSNIVVSEFGELLLSCDVAGSEPKLHWEIRGIQVNISTERYQLEKSDDGIENGVLKMKNVTLGDRGVFVCVGTNALTDSTKAFWESTSSTFVRVRSEMVLVWPALGILAEVLILGVTTIFARKADKKMNFE